MRMVLPASGSSTTLDSLEEMADQIVEVSIIPPVATVYEPSTSAELDSLRSEVRQLQESINK